MTNQPTLASLFLPRNLEEEQEHFNQPRIHPTGRFKIIFVIQVLEVRAKICLLLFFYVYVEN